MRTMSAPRCQTQRVGGRTHLAHRAGLVDVHEDVWITGDPVGRSTRHLDGADLHLAADQLREQLRLDLTREHHQRRLGVADGQVPVERRLHGDRVAERRRDEGFDADPAAPLR